jgi:hypothetical protein
VCGKIIPDHQTALRYETHTLQLGRVCDWIAADGNKVC